ncbi:MAG: hypothetical protein AAFO69_10920 [Bacteroidota bacterium]
MNTIKLFNPLTFLVLFSLLAYGCAEGPLHQDEEIAPSVSSKSHAEIKPGAVDSSQLRKIYIEWKPEIFLVHRDQIRKGFSDTRGTVYLHDYIICPEDPNVEEWRVTIRQITPKDQTPPPLVILMDTEDEMERAEYYQFSSECDF